MSAVHHGYTGDPDRKAGSRRAGVRGSVRGASHVFRHSLATHMIRSGASLNEIGQVLRHQEPDTARIYAKVDVAGLRSLSLAWPGGAQ